MPGAAVKGRERPVVEVPNVRGRAVVCKVSFGRAASGLSPAEEKHDIFEVHEGFTSGEGRSVMRVIKGRK